jgi:hypothetical protein
MRRVADFLKEQIRSRRWSGTMPGESRMVTRLQVGRDTVRAAGDSQVGDTHFFAEHQKYFLPSTWLTGR